MFSII